MSGVIELARRLRARDLWTHMRLPFQLTLAPIFLWGSALASGRWDARWALGFAAFHFFLYPGVTAFNSAYDRDEGPVGGLRHPPPVPPHLLAFSVLAQVVGAGLAFVARAPLVVVYLAIAVLGYGYSHPLTRWKASPWGSSLVVFAGQGGLGFVAGWLAAGGGRDPVRFWLGMAAAAFATLGLYPVTQVYQVEEDSARGDRTLAVRFGPARACALGMAALVVAAGASVGLLALRYSALDAALVAGAYAAAMIQVEALARSFRRALPSADAAFSASMRLTALSSAGFALFVLARLFGR